jgi:hypothetical protein
MSRYAWFFLVKAEALEGGDLLPPGSEAMLQVCVPGVELEAALLELSQFLAAEGYERRDLTIARRYDLENGEEEFPSDYLEGDLRHVATTGKSYISCVFVSRDSASYLHEKPS